MGKIKAISGNTAAALGASLCRPDVIAAYPITPQSSVVEYLAGMIAEGELDANYVQVESEHSAMSVIQGAAVAGGRVFTATSAQGLALMYEPYFRMSTLRLPMVMALATREMTSPETVWSGQQDAFSVRDAGWMQVFCENNQEILDMVVQGYKLAEHKDVLMPLNVCYDGFYLSHLTGGVDIPSQEEVDAFLPPISTDHVTLDPKRPMAVDPLTPGEILMKYRKDHLDSMKRALDVLEEVDREFGAKFGRSYGGAVEEYRLEDAEIALVTIGAPTGTGKAAVDMLREKGVKAGLLKVRFLRPFPAERIRKALEGKKAWAVLDRSVCFGWSAGPLYMEVRGAMLDAAEKACHFSAIGGLGGADIPLESVLGIFEKLQDEKDSKGQKETVWLMKD